MNKQLQSPRGMPDILPEDGELWLTIQAAALSIAREFSFGYLETPIIEDADLFARTVGETSDIVEKEMFSLKSRDEGVQYVLRPEGTAPAVRAYIQHGWGSLPQPVKVTYFGPMFRYERPQAGRVREHHQWGLEILGSDEPVDDALIMNMVREFLRRLGVTNASFFVNSIGDKACRSDLKNELKGYYRSRIKNMCADCERRYHVNPFRMLDCKNEKCLSYKERAPILIDLLCPECKEHFKAVLRYLDENGVPYELDNTLVRGLDYYTRTVFEITVPDKNISLGGGGRYDDLGPLIGSRAPLEAVGVGVGIERVALAVREANRKLGERSRPDVFLIALGDFAKAKSVALLNDLSRAGVRSDFAFGKKTLKEQLGMAAEMKIKYVIIMGQREVSDRTVIFKDMTLGAQEIVKFENIVPELQSRFKVK